MVANSDSNPDFKQIQIRISNRFKSGFQTDPNQGFKQIHIRISNRFKSGLNKKKWDPD
jgi:hypothetical protein